MHGNGTQCFDTSALIVDYDPNERSDTFSGIGNKDIDQSGVLCNDHVFGDSVQGAYFSIYSTL